MTNEITLTIEANIDDHELEHLTRQLQTEILKLDVDRVDRVNGAASPDGTRSGAVAVIPNELTITLIPEQVASLLLNVQHWLKRQQHSVESMMIKISVAGKMFSIGATDSEQKLKYLASLIEKTMAWLVIRQPTEVGEKTDLKLERITINPTVCLGQPTIRGMRITVSVILKLLESGQSIESVLADYPELEAEDVRQAMLYATWMVSEQRYLAKVA